MIDTPAAHGAPLFRAEMKRRADDFKVTEVLDPELHGTGEHLWLWIEKRDQTTLALVEDLQRAFAVGSADVGYSGLKDRVATTRQWISVRTPHGETSLELAGVRVIKAGRHGRKLRRGTHSGNRFEIVLRDVCGPASHLDDRSDDADGRPGEALEDRPDDRLDVSLDEGLHERLESIRRQGFPNYLGPQRFGHKGGNLVQARQWFQRPRRKLTRQKRSLLLSSARSALFNAVCAERVRQGCWNRLLAGEPVMLAGSRSFFLPERLDAELQRRCADLDIHPSGPWWGRGATLAVQDCLDLEASVLSDHALYCTGLQQVGLEQERRALRASAVDLTHDWLGERELRLTFTLDSGVFATTLLAECGVCVQRRPAQREEGGN